MVNQNGWLSSDKFQLHPWHKIPDDNNLSNYVTLGEAAKILHYSRITILRKVKRGKLKGFKCYGRWLIELPKKKSRVK